jgi:hypothetical protein
MAIGARNILSRCMDKGLILWSSVAAVKFFFWSIFCENIEYNIIPTLQKNIFQTTIYNILELGGNKNL